jgi:tetrahydromethanopterin S-methyltransferase subunit G
MNESFIMNILLPILTATTAGGGAFFGLKASLNGTKKRVEKIEDTTDKIWDKVNDTNSRLGVLEVKQEFTAVELHELKSKCGVNHG